MAGDETDRFVNIEKMIFLFKFLWKICIFNKIIITVNKKVLKTYIIFKIFSNLKPSSVAIIREVYDSENAHLKFEMELERALEAGVSVIVIEPEPLGEETARWIYVGNLLHKVSVYSGLCGIASGNFNFNTLLYAVILLYIG